MPLSDDSEHLRERFVAKVDAWRGAFLDVRRDRVALPDGSEADREFIVHPGAVMVIPLLGDDRVVVERQWRYPMARAMLEFPAGKLDPGEPVLDCAVRELAEETGYRATEWARAGILHNAISYSTEGIEVWFARRLVELVDRHREDVEELAGVELTFAGLEAARRGDITDAKTLVGLLWLANWRSGRWPLEWRSVAAAT